MFFSHSFSGKQGNQLGNFLNLCLVRETHDNQKNLIHKNVWYHSQNAYFNHYMLFFFLFNGIDYFTRKHINITIVKLEWNYGFLCLELFYCFSERGAHIRADFNILLNYENMSKIFYYKFWMQFTFLYNIFQKSEIYVNI